MMNFKYRSPAGQEEVNYVFGDPDYFTAYNIGVHKPLWMTLFNDNSHVIKSNARFVNKTEEPLLPTNYGYLLLSTRQSMLPLSSKSWYLAMDEGVNGLKLQKTGNGELSVQAALSSLENSKAQMIIAVLDASPTSAKYAVKVCGRFEAIDGIQTLPVSVYMIELNDQSFSRLSTNSSFDINTSNSCYDLSFDVSIS